MRGPFPPWLNQGEQIDGGAGARFDGLCVRCFTVEFDGHLANYKALLIEDVRRRQPTVDGIYYFDPDIVCVAPWNFFERWADCGVALCEDCTYPQMPLDHPLRRRWLDLLCNEKLELSHACSRYYNSGFVGLAVRFLSFAETWNRLLEAMARDGADLSRIKSGGRENPYQIPDQDALNLAAMATEHPLSTVGPDGMDFEKNTGYIMRHAADSPKPWRCRYLLRQLLTGAKPSPAHKGYWEHTAGPIRPFSTSRRLLARLDIAGALLVSRFYHR
jgi:hypothetical protein